jgi:peptide/nickel transport system permease protein
MIPGRKVRPGGLALMVLGAVALGAPLLANDRPLILRGSGWQFPALGEVPILGRLVEQPGWSRRDWSLPQPSERWRLSPPVPFSFRQVSLADRYAPPSRHHLLGADALGRDLAARIVHGTTVSVQVGLVSTCTALAIGVLLGALAGYTGRAADFVVSRGIEVALAFPTFFLLLGVLSLLPPSVPLLAMVIGLTRWPSLARYTRAEVMRLAQAPLVEAARAAGAGPARVLFRHILPHSLTPVLVAATFQMAGAMLVEAGLSFLGFGVPEPLPSWGGLLSQAQGSGRWWLVIFPGVALTLAITTIQVLGEQYREKLDPRLSRLQP